MTTSDYVKSVERSKVSPSATITLGWRGCESEVRRRKERDKVWEREQRDRHGMELGRVNLQGR